MTPFLVQPHEVDKFWGIFVPGLKEVQKTWDKPDWTLEDIKLSIETNHSYAVVAVKNNEVAGFFIGYPDAENSFFVWAAHLNTGFNLGEGFEMIADFAKSIGCTKLVFGTNRRGWERVAHKHGFRPTFWEKDLWAVQ
jgi:hypothetical protein